MREAIVKKGIVTNIIEGHIKGSTPCPDDVAIGWLCDGAAFTAPAPTPLTVPEQEDKLRSVYSAKIAGGFESSALGSPHTYASGVEDRINLIGAYVAGVDIMYKCTDSNGVNEFRPHTAKQMAQVFMDGMLFMSSSLEQRDASIKKVKAGANV